MRFFSLVLLLLGSGCATPMTRFVYSDNQGAKVCIEINMKEVVLEDLQVRMDGTKKTAEITVKKWESKSVDVLKAQTKREENAVKFGEKVTEAAVRAAIKSAIPVP
jgi:hypothetical protein